MQRMLLVGLLVGMAAPIVGTYLVQRRMALLGDGVGHVALAGVAAGWLAGSAAGFAQRDALAVPGAVIFAIAGAVIIERMRSRGEAADVVMAILFYGGIATGVLLIGMAGGSNSNLLGYLFGSISTVTWTDVWITAGLAVAIVAIGLGLQVRPLRRHPRPGVRALHGPSRGRAQPRRRGPRGGDHHRGHAGRRRASRERAHDPARGDRPAPHAFVLAHDVPRDGRSARS